MPTIFKVTTQYSPFILWRKVHDEQKVIGLFGEEIGITEYRSRVLSILYNKKLIENDNKYYYFTFDLAAMIKLKEIRSEIESIVFILYDEKDNTFVAYAYDVYDLITSPNIMLIGDGYAVLKVQKELK